MKRLLLVLSIILTLLLCSCATAKGDSKNPDQTKVRTPEIGTFTEADLVFVYEGVDYPLNSDASLLLTAFGADYVETKAPSCAYIGEDKMFEYAFATIFTYPLDGKDLIDEIDIIQEGYKTNKGIGPGSTLDEVKIQYGEKGFDQDGMYVYVLSGNIDDLKSPKLYFEFADDKVSSISYYGASNVQ